MKMADTEKRFSITDLDDGPFKIRDLYNNAKQNFKFDVNVDKDQNNITLSYESSSPLLENTNKKQK